MIQNSSASSRSIRLVSTSQLHELHRPVSYSPPFSPHLSPRRISPISASAYGGTATSTTESQTERESTGSSTYGRRYRYAPVSVPETRPSLYELLGLTSKATEQEIKAAYRKLAKSCHPDVATVDRKEVSTDNFMRIHAAYSTLSDPEKRAEYDRSLLLISSNQRIVYGRSASFSSPSSSSSSPYSPVSGFTRKNWETDQCW